MTPSFIHSGFLGAFIDNDDVLEQPEILTGLRLCLHESGKQSKTASTLPPGRIGPQPMEMALRVMTSQRTCSSTPP